LDISTPTFGRSASAPALQIEYNVGARPAAANQQLAVPRRLDRVGEIINGAGDKPGLAVVANPGANASRFREYDATTGAAIILSLRAAPP
jgi:hypothetical protein